MNKELQNKLFEKYPKIFRQKDLSMQETCMCWGITTGDGWYQLIDDLCAQIQWRCDHPSYKITNGKLIDILNWPLVKLNNGLYKVEHWCNGEFKKRVGFQTWQSGEYEKRKGKLIRKLIRKIPRVPYTGKYEEKYQIEATQVKEKFGGLRFYYSGGNEETSAMISFAEALSYKICEECGRYDNTVGSTSGWITTICKECVEKYPHYKDSEWKTTADWNKYNEMLRIEEEANEKK